MMNNFHTSHNYTKARQVLPDLSSPNCTITVIVEGKGWHMGLCTCVQTLVDGHNPLVRPDAS